MVDLQRATRAYREDAERVQENLREVIEEIRDYRSEQQRRDIMGVQAMRGTWSPVPRTAQRPVLGDQQRSSTPTNRAIASAQRPPIRDQPTAPRRDRAQR
eukprot:8423998-Karenia_brevis.AAC.1